jgi:hypothetical protein
LPAPKQYYRPTTTLKIQEHLRNERTFEFTKAFDMLATYLFGIRHSGINSRLVLFQEIFQKAVIQEFGSLSLWKHGPQQKGQFKCIVERNPVQEKVNKGFNQGKERKNHPVHEPLDVVSLVLALDGLEGFERRIQKADNRTKYTRAHAKEDQNHKDETSAQQKKFLRNLEGILSTE